MVGIEIRVATNPTPEGPSIKAKIRLFTDVAAMPATLASVIAAEDLRGRKAFLPPEG